MKGSAVPGTSVKRFIYVLLHKTAPSSSLPISSAFLREEIQKIKILVAGKAGAWICGGVGALHPQHSKAEEDIGREGKGGKEKY